jgi:hypothetical protein
MSHTTVHRPPLHQLPGHFQRLIAIALEALGIGTEDSDEVADGDAEMQSPPPTDHSRWFWRRQSSGDDSTVTLDSLTKG